MPQVLEEGKKPHHQPKPINQTKKKKRKKREEERELESNTLWL